MKSVRQLASEILIKNQRDGAYSTLSLNGVLKNAELPDAKDVSLLTMLVYGVIEHKLTLDYNLSLYLKSPLKKLHPAVLTFLRLGAYQILFADKIPDSAAVNESVKLAKQNGYAYAAGLINAVLRKISRNGLKLPEPSDVLKYLSVKYSCPEALISHYLEHYGEEKTEEILDASLGARPVYIRMNSLKTEEETLIKRLRDEGVTVSKTTLENAYSIENTGDITALSSYKEGLFHVQDLSSQLTVKLLDACPGETVVDCCSAPGGKTFTAAQYMKDRGKIFAGDIHEHKIRLISEGAMRLGFTSVVPVLSDAREISEKVKEADRVLCDVPCSGLGVIGRKPEIRYKDHEELKTLPPLQYDILSACAKMVKPGGTLVYSTCTLNPAENEEICDKFLSENPGFVLSDDEFYNLVKDGKYMTVFPSKNGGDGFFAAKFRRKEQ